VTARPETAPGWRVQLRELRITIALVRTTDSRRTALVAATSLVQAAVPVATSWITKLLLDAVP
jgi:hypothetical protein